MTKLKQYHFVFLFLLILSMSVDSFAQIEIINLDDILQIQPQIILDTPARSTEEKPQNNLNVTDLIHFGDLVDVDILGSSEYDWRGRITSEGFLDGIEFTDDEVYALCRTGSQVAEEIAKSYGKFLKNPKIVVTILDRSGRPISRLFGAVNNPQKFKIKRKVFLNELIVIAGGFTEKASGTIQVLRQPQASCVTKLNAEKLTFENTKINNEEFIKISKDNRSNYINIKIADLLNGNSQANLEILYGDTITVQTAEPVYVIGGVANPTKISIRDRFTVTRAIATAGGITDKADKTNVKIYRREADKTIIIKINLVDIAEQKANDVELKAYDIVEIAENGRDEKLYPPVINFEDLEKKENSTLPVTIID